jgi:hypothetical protein
MQHVHRKYMFSGGRGVICIDGVVGNDDTMSIFVHAQGIKTVNAEGVAPKFSDTLTLSQPGGGRFCPPLQRSNLNFPRDYVPV